MVNFKFDVVSDEPNKTKLILSGSLSENTRLPDLELDPGHVLEIHLNDLSHINSYGIMTWFKWVSMFGASTPVHFFQCQKVFIDMANTVKGVIPPNSKIHSFYVPYFCEDSEETIFVLYKDGDEIPESYKCDQCLNGADIDVNLSTYLAFKK